MAPETNAAEKIGAIIGSFVFFWVAPGTLAGWVPYTVTRWRFGPPLLGITAGRIVGAALAAAGLAAVLESFRRFAIEGRGTPAPIAPPRTLVVSGLYRYVRNPMYVAVTTMIVGQALLFGSVVLLEYSAIVWLGFHAFVLLYEEPTLRRKFGPSYDDYRANVRRWWPRAKPWRVDTPASSV
jgi:protein-S-isoprenylcysteine O-methyltransferase Ste14